MAGVDELIDHCELHAQWMNEHAVEITVYCERYAAWLQEQAVTLHEAGLEDLAKELVNKAEEMRSKSAIALTSDVVTKAEELRTKASWALATPSDESRPGGGWIDDMIDQFKMPWVFPPRPSIMWLMQWARRARSVVRHLAGVAEAYNEPATKVAAAQRLLDEIEIGPPSPTPSKRRR